VGAELDLCIPYKKGSEVKRVLAALTVTGLDAVLEAAGLRT